MICCHTTNTISASLIKIMEWKVFVSVIFHKCSWWCEFALSLVIFSKICLAFTLLECSFCIGLCNVIELFVAVTGIVLMCHQEISPETSVVLNRYGAVEMYVILKECSYYLSYFISSYFIQTECFVKRPSLLWLWLWPVRYNNVTYFIMIGCSHGELLWVTSQRTQIRWSEVRWDQMTWVICTLLQRHVTANTWLLIVWWFQSDFPKDSDMVESFQCSETQTNRWRVFIYI